MDTRELIVPRGMRRKSLSEVANNAAAALMGLDPNSALARAINHGPLVASLPGVPMCASLQALYAHMATPAAMPSVKLPERECLSTVSMLGSAQTWQLGLFQSIRVCWVCASTPSHARKNVAATCAPHAQPPDAPNTVHASAHNLLCLKCPSMSSSCHRWRRWRQRDHSAPQAAQACGS